MAIDKYVRDCPNFKQSLNVVKVVLIKVQVKASNISM